MLYSCNEKRKSDRQKSTNNKRRSVEIFLPVPSGFKIKKDVFDISDTGLSFIMPSEEGCFVPGTPITELYIENNGYKIKKSLAEVKYVKELVKDGGIDYKIGIQFNSNGLDRKEIFGLGSQYKFRLERHDFSSIKSLSSLIKFTDRENNQVIGQLINFSSYGIAFIIEKKDPILKKSDKIDNFTIIINRQVIFEGAATVVNITERKNGYIVRVSFGMELLNTEKLFLIKKRLEVKEEVNHFCSNIFLKVEELDNECKEIVMDLKYYFENLKKELTKIEMKIKNEPSSVKRELENEILKSTKKGSYKYFDKQLMTLNELRAKFSCEEDTIHRQYFQEQLHPLWLLAPFNERIYKKPLGYAGDYEMINMIFRNAYEGESLFAKFLHKYSVNVTPAVAHRNRVPLILETFKQYTKSNVSKNNDPLNILCVGSGPAKEVEKFIKTSDSDLNCNYTLIDFDKRALEYCSKKLLRMKNMKRHNINLNFINITLRRLVREINKIDLLKEQDIIYVFGLFDYLPENFSKLFVKVLFKNLRKGGRLLISNVHKRNQYRCYMEYGGEWYLYYRDEEELMELGDKIKDRSKLSITAEKTNYNIFLVAEK